MTRKRVLAFEVIELDKTEYAVKKTNPKYWKQDGVRKNFHYFYAPNHPAIIAAYEEAGVEQLKVGGEDTVVEPEPLETPAQTAVESADEVSETEVDDTPWRDLSWPKMRSKATEFTDEPIKNKDMAVEVLEQAEQEGKL